jgi:hypothetical protein
MTVSIQGAGMKQMPTAKKQLGSFLLILVPQY